MLRGARRINALIVIIHNPILDSRDLSARTGLLGLLLAGLGTRVATRR